MRKEMNLEFKETEKKLIIKLLYAELASLRKQRGEYFVSNLSAYTDHIQGINQSIEDVLALIDKIRGVNCDFMRQYVHKNSMLTFSQVLELSDEELYKKFKELELVEVCVEYYKKEAKD